MEVNKTVMFTFFKAPKIHVNNAADKQENISKKEETLILYQNQISKCHVCIASIFYGILEMGDFGYSVYLVTALGCLQCIYADYY